MAAGAVDAIALGSTGPRSGANACSANPAPTTHQPIMKAKNAALVAPVAPNTSSPARVISRIANADAPMPAAARYAVSEAAQRRARTRFAAATRWAIPAATVSPTTQAESGSGRFAAGAATSPAARTMRPLIVVTTAAKLRVPRRKRIGSQVRSGVMGGLLSATSSQLRGG